MNLSAEIEHAGVPLMRAPRLQALLLPVLGLAALAALVLVGSAGTDGDTVPAAILVVAVGAGYAAAGLIAWQRHGQQHAGVLLVVLALTWLSGMALGAAGSDAAAAVGVVAVELALALAVHAQLAYPGSSRTSGKDRALVAAAYVALPALGVAAVLRDDVRAVDDRLLLVGRGTGFGDLLTPLQGWLAVSLAVAVVLVLVQRWRWATRPVRRALAPVHVAAGTAATCLAGAGVGESLSVGAARALNWIGFVALAAVPAAFVANRVQSRLARAELGSLVLELGGTLSPGALRDAIARSLGDPSLEVAYWFPDGSSWVDLNGRPFELPWEGSSRVVTKVEREDNCVAALVHDRAVLGNPQLLRAVSAAAGLALENERLQAELRARLDELHASRARIVEAGDAERRRLERNLHDGAQQRLVALSLGLRVAEVKAQRDPSAVVPLLAEAREELAQALEELRELARGIHPAILSDRGLGPALRAAAARSPVDVSLDVPEERLPHAVEAALYYVVSEALANVAKYAHAQLAEVRVEHRDGLARAEVRDDGIGGADPTRGSGLRGLDDRVAALDGRLQVESPPGGGTRLLAEIPCC